MPTRIAIDCDLRRVHAWCEKCGKICTNVDSLTPVLAHPCARTGVFLFEVASALDYTDSKAIAYNKRRWTIWNIATATRLHAAVGDRLLVAPSHKWTKGFDVKVRHKLANAEGDNKDVRECRAMLWFATQHPAAWVPFDTFLADV